MNQNNGYIKPLIISLIAIFLVIGIIFVFRTKDGGNFLDPRPNGGKQGDKDDRVPAPLTGVLFSPTDAEKFTKIRPLGVMVNNHSAARPQSGLAGADVVYEIVAEGGITRFLAFFNSKVPEKIGPVRSTREYYLVLVKEMGDAMLMHIGWSPQALTAIESWPVRSLGRGNAPFWRDQGRLDAGVAYEHTAYVSGKVMLEKGEELGWEGVSDAFVPYKFKDDSPIGVNTNPEVKKASKVKVDFWYPGDYTANWVYDSTTNSYKRFMGYDANDNPLPHNDADTNMQLTTKNLVVQYAKELGIEGDEKNRLDYELVGSGEGLVFIDGTVYNVTWSKASRDERTLFFTDDGEEVKFNRGNFWIEIVPDRNTEQVVYE